MAGVIRVVLVDDHPVASAGVTMALQAAGDVEIAGIAGDLERAVALVGAVRPDVILCDIQIGHERGLDLPGRLGKGAPPIVFFTSFDYPSYVRAALDAGAAGFVLKTAPLEKVVAAIRAAAEGGTTYTTRDLRAAREARRIPSSRELEVLSLLAAGRTNADIGLALEIDERTIESHLRRLFVRYDVASRTELSMLALGEGWIDIDAVRSEAEDA